MNKLNELRVIRSLRDGCTVLYAYPASQSLILVALVAPPTATQRAQLLRTSSHYLQISCVASIDILQDPRGGPCPAGRE